MTNEEAKEAIIEILKHQIYFSTEIANLVNTGFSFAELKKVQALAAAHKKELDPKDISDNPKLARLVLLMQKFVESAHCQVCSTICLTAAFLGSKVEEVKNQNLH